MAAGEKIVFCVALYRSMLVLFLLAIVLPALALVIFKLFLLCFWIKSEYAILHG